MKKLIQNKLNRQCSLAKYEVANPAKKEWPSISKTSGLMLAVILTLLTNTVIPAKGSSSAPDTPVNFIRIAMSDGKYKDETLIHFFDDASTGKDKYDAYKLKNDIFNLSSLSDDGSHLVINAWGPLTCNPKVSLSIDDVDQVPYILEFTELDSFEEPIKLFLIDNYLNAVTEIINGEKYNFIVTSDSASYGSTRFKINFNTTDVNTEVILTTPEVICEEGIVEITLNNTTLGNQYQAFIDNIAVSAVITASGSTDSLSISFDYISEGNNNISIKATQPGCSSIYLHQTKDVTYIIPYAVESVEGDTIIPGGRAILKAAGGTEIRNYRWYEVEYNSDTSVVLPYQETDSGYFETSALTITTDFLVSIVYQGGCESSTTRVTAEVLENGNFTSYIDLNVSASGYTDHAYVQFIDTAKFEFDIADASKLENKIFNLATMSTDSVLLAINAMSGQACVFDIPIRLWNTWDDTYTFNWNLTPDLLYKYSISLEDRYTKQVYAIDDVEASFDFFISKDAATKATDRFVFHFESLLIDNNIIIETSQVCEDQGKASIHVSTSQYGVDYALWQDNQEIVALAGTGEMLTFELDSSILTSGVNAFLLRASRSNCATQWVDFNVEMEYFDTPEIVSVTDGLTCSNSPVTLMVSNAINAATFKWYENELDEEPITETDSATFITPFLTASHLYFVSAINALGCESERVPIEAKVNLLAQPLVTVDTVDFDNYILNSSYIKDNQWFFNNTLLIGETKQTLKTVEPGFYKVQVNSGDCSVSSDSVEVNNLVLAVEDLAEQVKISMYPNPATDKVMVSIPTLRNQAVQVLLYSLDGKVQHQVDPADHNNATIAIDLRSYLPGTYILKVVVNTTPQNYRLIIQ